MEAICTMYEQGAKVAAVAEKHGVHTNTVYDVLERAHVPLRRPRRSYLSPDEMQEIRRLYEEGLSYKAIAEKMGLSWPTVEKYGKRAGVTSRPAGFQQGEGHHAWKGGRTLSDGGYVLVLVRPDDPFYPMAQIKAAGEEGSRYCLEQRLVMARHLGRLLTAEETVHHVDDCDRQNNAITNLQLRLGNHGKGAALHCADCGSCNIVAGMLN